MLELESPCGKNPVPANLAILFVFAQEDIGLGHVIHFPAALLAQEWLLFARTLDKPESLAEFLECAKNHKSSLSPPYAALSSRYLLYLNAM